MRDGMYVIELTRDAADVRKAGIFGSGRSHTPPTSADPAATRRERCGQRPLNFQYQEANLSTGASNFGIPGNSRSLLQRKQMRPSMR
jgi:hypothetical protein